MKSVGRGTGGDDVSRAERDVSRADRDGREEEEIGARKKKWVREERHG